MKQTIIIWMIAIIKFSAGNQLNNDTCASAEMNNISSRIAQIVCDKDAKIFDPTNQSGVYLFDTGSWNKSEIFSCQCNCHMPKIPENGRILSESIGHGETFKYICNEGFQKTINRKITCYDGVLMLMPDYLEDYKISIAFRRKSLPEWVTNDFQGEILELSVNETSSWTIPETEVRSNQKYFQSLNKNETVSEYYLFNGVGYKTGIVGLKTRLVLKCIRTKLAPSDEINAGIIAIVPAVFVLCLILAACYFCKQKKICLWHSKPTTEPSETHHMLHQQTVLDIPTTEPNETHQMSNQQIVLDIHVPTTEPNETHQMLNQ